MTQENRLAIQALCNQIAELVGKQDLDFGYHEGDVLILIASGAAFRKDEGLWKAISAYLQAKQGPDPAAELPKARKALIRAVEEWADQTGQ
jgi:hypothetical protein